MRACVCVMLAPSEVGAARLPPRLAAACPRLTCAGRSPMKSDASTGTNGVERPPMFKLFVDVSRHHRPPVRPDGGSAPAAETSRRAEAASVPNFAPDSSTAWTSDRPQSDDFLPPPSGPGPVLSDGAHPYVPNGQGQPTYRIADLTNPILQPWVIEWMRQGQRGSARPERFRSLHGRGAGLRAFPASISTTAASLKFISSRYPRWSSSSTSSMPRRGTSISQNVPHSNR